ncbi:sugar ABC transporter substrate-binding protein [Pararhizobium mangrovi]|uniref:Sugar ABC transporter substrate-binding protein n=2 Tax=Pararhizobium mangrovi TaxID=2590452 RepID=A0A506U8T7_9HYPH|nr:sugar ABC transporter substrate-binding protein [Pararhizobium mangrovi]
MKRWTTGLAATLALVAVAGIAHAETIRVTVAEYSKKTGPYFNDAAKAFEKDHPDAKVQIEVVPWDNLLQKLTTDISAGANADVSIIGTRWLIDFVSQDIVTPLDPYMTQSFKDRFFPVFFKPAVMDGKTYGLPIAASARAMYYNKALFKKAGIDTPPDTWSELAADAKKISALGDDIAGFGLQGKEIETDVYFDYAFWAYGGELVTKDGKSGLDSKAGYDAANLYKKMIDDGSTQPGVTSYTREDVQNLFKQGKVGMMITAPFLSKQIKAEAPNLDYGVAAIPAGPNGDRGTYGVTDSIVMFKNSEHKKLAWQFMDMLFTKKWRERFTSSEGFLPVNKEVAKMPEFADDADLKQFTNLLPDARFAPVISGWEQIADTTKNALQTIYLGKGEVKPTLDQAAQQINELLKQ